MNEMKIDLNAKKLENEALREDFSHNLNQIQNYIRKAHSDNLEATKKLMMLDYDRRIATIEEENRNLRHLNENFEKILEQERMKYVFQRILFITAKGKKDYPRVIDFIYGRTLTMMVEKKDE